MGPSGQSHATCITCIFEAKFFINGAIKSATLLAQCSFASVNSSSTPSEIKNSAVIEKLRNAISRHLELTMIAIITGAVGFSLFT